MLVVGLGSLGLAGWCWFWYRFHRRRWGALNEMTGWRAYFTGMAFINAIVWGTLGVTLIILGLIYRSYLP